MYPQHCWVLRQVITTAQRGSQACPGPHSMEDGGPHTRTSEIPPSLRHHVASRDGPA